MKCAGEFGTREPLLELISCFFSWKQTAVSIDKGAGRNTRIRKEENQAQGARNNKKSTRLDETKHNQRQNIIETTEVALS
jgi:hypothetical protein